MSSEIATWGMIRSKVPSFPVPEASRKNECLTKSEILATRKALVNGNYGDNEYPLIDDIFPAKDIALGYVDSNNQVQYIATLMNNPTFSKAEIKNIIGNNNTVIIFTGYPNFMSATLHDSIMQMYTGSTWIKLPCINNSGSCIYNAPLTKIDAYSCYTEGIYAAMLGKGNNQFRFSVEVGDVSSGIIEYSPVIYFTLTD